MLTQSDTHGDVFGHVPLALCSREMFRETYRHLVVFPKIVSNGYNLTICGSIDLYNLPTHRIIKKGLKVWDPIADEYSPDVIYNHPFYGTVDDWVKVESIYSSCRPIGSWIQV